MSDKAKQPKDKCKKLTFIPIPEFSDASLAFGANENQFFNRMDLPDIPSHFEDMAQQFFFNGGDVPRFKEGIDATKAVRALRAWLCSFAPAHESKIATVGYALWCWCEDTGGANER